MKVLGIKRLTGTYENRPYDNYYLFCSRYSNQEGIICGACPDETVKVKADVLHECVAEENVKSLLGLDIDVYLNSYKNVVKVFVKE